MKPDASKVRTWTDRSGTFKVEAEFIGLKDGKIHLHKLNGVKIAVPVAKMAVEDLEYVEKVTGVSLDEDKPLSDIKRRNTQRHKEKDSSREQKKKSGVSFANDKSDYDWFDFFLQAGCNPQICERYANAFSRDQMGEEVLPDVDPHLLRTLGLKEGDILRVMKFLDKKFGRTGQRNVSFGASQAVGDEKDPDAIEPVNGSGGLFSGQGGALRNNTRKGRPAPPVQTNDVVDPDAFKQKTDDTENKALHAEAAPTPLANTSARTHTVSGFDDDAWDVKPSKTPAAAAAAAPAATPSPAPQAAALTPAPAPAPAAPALTGSMNELSLLSPPLQPTPAPQPTPQPAAQPAAPPQQPARTGADPSFFDKLAAPAPPRERPQAPQQTGGSLIAPPPARAASAPGFNPQQPGGFGLPPLQPQLTGYRALQGQSLQDLNQQRLQQQQFSQMQPQMTGFPQQQQPGFQPMMPQPTGFTQFQQQQPQQTGFPQFQQQPTGFQPSVQQQFINGQATGSPFADPPRAPFQPTPSRLQSSLSPQSTLYPQQTGFMQPQPTGFMQQPQQQQFPQQLQPQQTGFGGLPPALQPQLTGVNGFGQQNGFGQPAPTLPPMPPMPTGFAQPLVPQKTGPAPPVRFGTQPANKLTPQPTGRANLRNATPQNPFGF
ncbi:cytoskeletal protein binding protein [Taxawa tesnikishii (nom. ined.)]|nr:cytoskeletal protein binding protein [Dothideales sp. JES 119]